MEECKNGQSLVTRAKLAEHPVEKVGANLRAMMLIGKKISRQRQEVNISSILGQIS